MVSTFRKPMFRVYLYEQRGDDWGGKLHLTNSRHKIDADLSKHFDSLQDVPRMMMQMLEKSKLKQRKATAA